MAERPSPAGRDPMEIRFTIPPQLLELFRQEPRVVIKWRPDGIWPIDAGMLQKMDWGKLASSEEFTRNFEVVVMRRG